MTNKPLDRISEAYKGDMGEDFAKKTRNRINWIVNSVKGNRILDVGCSQGVIPIILGREGKKVDALDIAQESIEYAKTDLEKEHPSVQENIKFKVSNFMTEEQLESSYETILLTEVLEHISDPLCFLKKIHDHLEIDGRLVVTVPFGINDYFDHKRTYYFLELNEQLSEYFSVEKIEYLGNWVGVICKKTNDGVSLSKETVFSRETIEKLEKAFYTVERELMNRIEKFQLSIKEKNEYIKKIQDQHKQSIEKFKEQIAQRDSQIKLLNDRINGLKNIEKLDGVNEERETIKKLLQQIKEQNIEFNSFIVNVESQHRRYIEKFEEQILQKEREIGILKQKEFDFKLQQNNQLGELKEEKETNRKLLQQIKEQNIEFNSLILNVENQHRRYIEKFEEQILEKEREIGVLKQKEFEYKLKQNNQLDELKEEKETNRKLLQQIKEQNNQFNSLIVNLENQHRRYIEQFEAQMQNREREILELKETIEHFKHQQEANIREIGLKNNQIEELLNINSELEEEREKNCILLEKEIEKNENIVVLEDEVRNYKEQIRNYEEQIEQKNIEIKEQRVKKDLEINKLNNIIKELKKNESNASQNDHVEKDANTRLLQQMKDKDQLIQELTNQVNTLKFELFNSLNSEEKALKLSLKEMDKSNKLENLIGNLENKLSKLERKYLALKSSKLGSFTLKYWQLRRKLSK